MSDDLLKLPFLVHLSRKTLSTIKANIIFSLMVKAAFISLVFAGMANLWMAVAADTGTSLLVILYSMRLINTDRKESSNNDSYNHEKKSTIICGCDNDHDHHKHEDKKHA